MLISQHDMLIIHNAVVLKIGKRRLVTKTRLNLKHLDAYKAFNTVLFLYYGQWLEKFTKTCLDQDTQEITHLLYDYVLSFKRVILIFFKKPVWLDYWFSAHKIRGYKHLNRRFFIQIVHSEPKCFALPHIRPLKT